MREQQAKDFWSVYLKLILRKGQETTIVNPFEEFRDSVAKGGYESVSDEEYANIYDQVEELSVFWQQRPKDSVAHIVIEALSRTHLYEDEIQDIAGILAEASERTNYTQQMLQEMGAEEAEKRMADRKKAKLPPVPPDYPEKEWIEAEYGFEGVYEETPFDDTDYSWTPKLIYQYLGEHVYGQEEAKRGAAMLVYNHLQGHRRNMLVAGPTGCGKTEIWRTLQKKFSFIKIINGPQLSCDGWKGSYHMKDIFVEEPAEKAKKMLVVIDEADKLFEPSIGAAGVDYARKIQNEFLKIMDGDKVEFVSEGNDAKKTTVDCSNVSFVFCGSFETLLQNREDKPATIGFFQSAASDEEEDSITIEDLVEYGNVRREIAGRIQQIVSLNALTVDDFEHILNSRKQMSPIRQLEKLYMVNLSIDEKTMRILAEKAAGKNLGCRYMRSQIQSMLDEKMFDDPDCRNFKLSLVEEKEEGLPWCAA